MVKHSLMVALLALVCCPLASSKNTDPTRPDTATSSQGSGKRKIRKAKLSAIFVRNDSRQAIINGKLYRVGDFFQGQKVKSIHPTRVALIGAQGTYYLTLIDKIKK